MKIHYPLIFLILFVLFNRSYSQIPLTVGGYYNQDFNSLGGAAIATLPENWRVSKHTSVRFLGSYSSAVTQTERNAGNNMSSTASNGIYNFGAGDANTATDRAVGGLSASTGSHSVNIYAYFKNVGNEPITQLNISYKVERYRNGSNSAGFTVQMYYSYDGSTWVNAGDNFKTSFTSNTDNNGGSPTPLETKEVTNQILVVDILTDSSFYLAWNYSVTTGSTTTNAQALGIDDVLIDNVLPVNLVSFDATLINRVVQLKWSTATETQNYGFEIERAKVENQLNKNLVYQKIGFVKGSGNSNSYKVYTFEDKEVFYGVYAYRLKQLDYDGSYAYSNEVLVNVGEKPTSFGLKNFPNPFNPITNIEFELPYHTNVEIAVYNIIGEKVATIINEYMTEGVYRRTFDGSHLNSGVYFYVLRANGVTLTKKMLLVK